MADRLVKIAKELNIAVGTLIDFLASKGVHDANKPTSLVSDDVHNMLLKEFSSSIAEKEKADQIVIGTRPGLKEDLKAPIEEKPVNKPLFTIPSINDIDKTDIEKPDLENKVEETIKVEKKVEPKAPIEESPQVTTPADPNTIAIDKPELPKLKIVGKIDLDKSKPAKKTKEKVESPKDKVQKTTESTETTESTVTIEHKGATPQSPNLIQESIAPAESPDVPTAQP